jgi:chemotaxis methyl-accepting protein methylase
MSQDGPEVALDQVAGLLAGAIGLRPDPTLRGRLGRAVRDEVAERGGDLTTYASTLIADPDAMQGLIDRITVQESAFFRHPRHFQVLAEQVLPALSPPVTIWSVGCANGQEAYSLAMLLEEQGVDGRVIATDVSTAALQRTAAARYTGRELAGLSPQRIADHLTRSGEAWKVSPSIRTRVSTRQYNLVDPLPTEILTCQVVFCRNILIYLSPERVCAFLDQLADNLPPTISLFVGAGETLWQVSDRFEAVPAGDTFVYRPPRADAVSARNTLRRRPAPASSHGAPIPRVRDKPTTASESRSSTGDRNRPEASQQTGTTAALLAAAGQSAVAANDYDAAVVAFRKCAYLEPDDPMSQLHLGLALEGAGDPGSARRAYASSRRLLESNPSHDLDGIEGYATAELLRLLDFKERALTK